MAQRRGVHDVATQGAAAASMSVALQMAAGIEIERAGRFLNVMDTMVTMAPLLAEAPG